MSVLLSFSLYFLSFSPLWLSIIFVDAMSIIKESANTCTERISIALILVASILCFGITLFSLSSKKRDGTQSFSLDEVTEEKTITSEFLLSYILPLFAFNFTLWEEVILFLIFFVTFGLLCIRHSYFCVNIILELIGYRFYRCRMTNEDNVTIIRTVISRKRLNGCVNENVDLRAINNDMMVDITR